MDSKISREINDWAQKGPETLALGILTNRTVTMFSYLPQKDEGLTVSKNNDLGIAYAIGFQAGHVQNITELGISTVVNAYNALKDYFNRNPLPAEETNGSTN